MMFKCLLVAVLVGVISANTDTQWSLFKAKYNKVYDVEETMRRSIWEENMQFIRSHNVLFAKGLKSYYLNENEFADMTNYEFVKTMNGYKGEVSQQAPVDDSAIDVSALPSTVDWRKKGYVTPVKNQGQCGSCWAFSATGSLEGAHFKKTGKLVSLSEKNLVDCSWTFRTHGCRGGYMDNAFRYVIANKGIDTEKSYPYLPEQGKCKFNRTNVGSSEVSYEDITSGSESALQKAVAEIGPISVAIDAGHRSFQLYAGGVYNDPQCSSTRLDHGVLAVGYGNLNGKDYWLVKNSWGTSWGEKGYIMMSRNENNQCGIATNASYPIV